MKKLVCYTCCTGGYDSFLEHSVVNNEWDYVYFTDNKDLISKKKMGMWTIKPLAYTRSTLVKQGRWHKTHPHKLFPEYEYSLYVDSNISIQTDRVFRLVDHFIAEGIEIAIPKHPERNCIYKEAQEVKACKIEHEKVIDKEMKVLRKANYPENNGLFETNVIFRQHHHQKIKKAMNEWWKMIHHYSKRDQLSFNYVMWTNNIVVTPFYKPYENHHTNGDFLFVEGKNHTQDKIKVNKGHFWNIYLFGQKIFSFKVKSYEEIYAKRFDGLTEKDICYCLKEQFNRALGYALNLDHPETFNEKLQWLKLYYHRHPNPLITKCADKVAVRDYIKEKIGEEYLIPCLGIWDNPDEIDFDKLPNQFVLKVNWGSGQNIIVKDKSKLNIEETKQKLAEWMKPESNHYYAFFEWCYRNIQPKIIAEKYMGVLKDYKIMCYNGNPKNIFVCSERYSNLNITIFDLNWNRLPFKRKHPLSFKKIEKPECFDKMLEISKTLAESFPFVRVDFFCLNNQLYVGELTFFPGAGIEKFEPLEWDKKLGDLLILPKEEK